MDSHHRQDLFKQTLENGRVVKKPKTPSTPQVSTGYPIFLKLNYSKLKAQNPHLDTKQVRNLVSVQWRALGKVGQQAYKTVGGSTGEEALLGHQRLQQQVQQDVLQQQVEQLQGQVRAQQQRMQGQLDRFTPDLDQRRINRCNICGELFHGLQEVNNHIETQVKIVHNTSL